MSANVAVFFFGLALYLIVILGVVAFYLSAFQAEAESRGISLPGPFGWFARVLGLTTAPPPPDRKP